MESEFSTVTILIIVIEILIGITSFLTTGISILVWNRITNETKNRKEATNALWEKANGNTDKIEKNKNNIVKIGTSVDIDLIE
jgi:uncharacterized protein HemY